MRKRSLPSPRERPWVWLIFGLAVWMLTASLFHWGIPKPEWLFASGEIRQIASVEKRQFGSAEIRQFESIEKSQS